MAGLVWASAIGYVASGMIMHGDEVKHGCPTPAELGWAYEAVNYDIALDEQLPDGQPGLAHGLSEPRCRHRRD